MDWRQQRKYDLEQRMLNIVELLGQCEQSLTYEDDPQIVGKLKTQISKLKRQKKECESDLDSHGQGEAQRNLALTMATITNEDLNFVISALLRQRTITIEEQNNSPPTKPEEKMSKNGLTSSTRFLLDAGLPKANEVRHLIENNAKLNFPDIPEKLKAALKAEYLRLIEEGVYGNDLFDCLHRFSSCNSPDFRRQVAGLSVLCYFFEACDVFEP